VISRAKWERKKKGLDSWNDDVALEIDTHRYLTKEFNHPNIVKFEAVTQDAMNVYYYQEAGFELFGHVQQHRQRFWSSWRKHLQRQGNKKYYLDNKSPWEKRGTEIFRGIFEAVQMLHENGIAHRDIKLENMVVCGDGGELQGKLIDFGVCLRHGDWEQDMENHGRVGTYPFYSPEMAFNNRQLSAQRAKCQIANYETYDAAKNDVWLLGHALFGYSCGVLLWQDIGASDVRFTVATRAAFSTEAEKWKAKRLGLRYLARRYGPERNEMVTDDLIDLLEHIFVPEAERYTIEECLAHRWFKTRSTAKELEMPEPPTPPSLSDPFTPLF